MDSTTIKTATGLIAAYMRACELAGWTSFWSTIYVLPGSERDERLLRHDGRNYVPS